ncbi:OsmC family protein [Actinophytocola algeriensis]|uniref:Ohr subfamily peroxiredoxin n=1 Tax=Actinophytocola algeriensis TaxID=1768010 RepID=A0A7W7VGM8_9PSEU|nr:OsmC family protein [Actinophytocola algeriensis]MBB4909597.1 Ohr subfamily peroxiredoxin [Actinophytocola algeriensis]MBE1475587.1 Ohr subfamily peroxiredoxin [Actinophytocola algeriensis]
MLHVTGWASCFLGAVRRAAAERKARLSDLAVVAEVTPHHDDGEFRLSAAPNVEMSGVDQDTADALGAAAHRICPYSKATRDNIDVTITATVA